MIEFKPIFVKEEDIDLNSDGPILPRERTVLQNYERKKAASVAIFAKPFNDVVIVDGNEWTFIAQKLSKDKCSREYACKTYDISVEIDIDLDKYKAFIADIGSMWAKFTVSTAKILVACSKTYSAAIDSNEFAFSKWDIAGFIHEIVSVTSANEAGEIVQKIILPARNYVEINADTLLSKLFKRATTTFVQWSVEKKVSDVIDSAIQRNYLYEFYESVFDNISGRFEVMFDGMNGLEISKLFYELVGDEFLAICTHKALLRLLKDTININK